MGEQCGTVFSSIHHSAFVTTIKLLLWSPFDKLSSGVVEDYLPTSVSKSRDCKTWGWRSLRQVSFSILFDTTLWNISNTWTFLSSTCLCIFNNFLPPFRSEEWRWTAIGPFNANQYIPCLNKEPSRRRGSLANRTLCRGVKHWRLQTLV